MSDDEIDIKVIAHSGHRGEQEPRALVVEGVRVEVSGIADRWYEPDAAYFKAAAADGWVYLLRCDFETLSWTLVSREVTDA